MKVEVHPHPPNWGPEAKGTECEPKGASVSGIRNGQASGMEGTQ